MKALVHKFLFTLTMLQGVVCFNSNAGTILDLTYQEMREVVKLARSINVLQPFLKDGKYVEYALAVYRAAQKYEIDPNVLIAITQQETNFREALPEGRAGEIGICQIRKIWLNNPKFRAEFKKATVLDLSLPSKSFMFAAWILRDLKNKVRAGSLPFWSYYNAVRFENRFKYFLSVNKNLVALRRHEPFYVARHAASETGFVQLASSDGSMGSPKEESSPVTPLKTPLAKTPKTENQAAGGKWVADALSKVTFFSNSPLRSAAKKFKSKARKEFGWAPLVIEAGTY